MKLSIITINLNNRDGLKRTIDSVVSQTFTDYEWIVIDGGSTDGSCELIEQYSNRFTYWCSEPDKGIYNAMNKGIAHAKGEWLQFLNSGDSFYESSTLEHVFNIEHNCDIIYGNGIHEHSRDLIIYPSQLSLSYLLKHSISHQASFYKRYLYSKKLFDESFSVISDYVSIIEFAIADKKFEYVNLIIVNVEEDGISSSNIGTNEINGLDHLIPSIIKMDIDKLNEYEEQLRFIQSHRSLKFVNNFNNKIIHILGNIIRNKERKK